MNIRDAVRRLRLYYQSWHLLRHVFHGKLKILLFPFFGNGKFVAREGGLTVEVPRPLWMMLPTAARCVIMGILPRWKEDGLHVRMTDIEIVGPADAKAMATYISEIFIEDVYRLNQYDLKDQVVVDVGAFIGDTAIAFARRGAYVHAFEPLAQLAGYITRNASLNGVADRVVVHPVGLSDRDNEIVIKTPSEQRITLVDAATYLRNAGVGNPYLLKLDCEGCEYDLLANEPFWALMRPEHILMEFHRGADALAKILQERGYRVEPYSSDKVGYLFARL